MVTMEGDSLENPRLPPPIAFFLISLHILAQSPANRVCAGGGYPIVVVYASERVLPNPR